MIKEHWIYIPGGAEAELTDSTYYSYEYNDAIHEHYVILHFQNCAFGDTPATRNAALFVVDSQRTDSKGNPNFKFDIEEGQVEAEVFDHVYLY